MFNFVSFSLYSLFYGPKIVTCGMPLEPANLSLIIYTSMIKRQSRLNLYLCGSRPHRDVQSIMMSNLYATNNTRTTTHRNHHNPRTLHVRPIVIHSSPIYPAQQQNRGEIMRPIQARRAHSLTMTS